MLQNNFRVQMLLMLNCQSFHGNSKPFGMEKSDVYLGCLTEAYSCLWSLAHEILLLRSVTASCSRCRAAIACSSFWRWVQNVPANCAPATHWPVATAEFFIIFSLHWFAEARGKLKGPSEHAVLSFEMDISIVKFCPLITLHLYEICTRAKQMNKQRRCSVVGAIMIHNPVMKNREWTCITYQPDSTLHYFLPA